MAQESKTDSTFPVGNLLAVLIFAAGVIVQQLPLESWRPKEGAPHPNRFVGIQDVPARLWEDPFSAMARYHDDSRPTRYRAGTMTGRDLSTLKKVFSNEIEARCQVTVLGVMVFGGQYAEDVEQRRRMRYAVLSSLSISGFAPDDAEFIGFVQIPRGKDTNWLPKAVPFEWLNVRAGDSGARSRGLPDIAKSSLVTQPEAPQGSSNGVLILWIEDEPFAFTSDDKTGRPNPIANLEQLLTLVSPDKLPACRGGGQPRIDYKVIGPASSGTLRAMRSEIIDEKSNQFRPVLKKIKLNIYSPSATAAAEYRAKGTSVDFIRLLDRKGTLTFLRTISTDDQLAAEIVAELQRRGINPGRLRDNGTTDHIAIVSEWDTYYGQQLPCRVIAAARDANSAASQAVDAPACGGEPPGWALHYTYLRGLDGEVVSGRAAQDKPRKDDSTEEAARAAHRSERADGDSQFDYLRRISAALERKNAELRENGRGAIRAVGILGSDFHDKLLVLRALRKSLPAAQFFTFDMDSRYLQSEQFEWTRNVIVASSFGLSLHAALQHSIPPFRDGYQTAAFLATQLAFAHGEGLDFDGQRAKLNRWLSRPRLFEIGRTQAFELTQASYDIGSNTSGTASCLSLQHCSDVHPVVQRSLPNLHGAWWAMILIIVGLFSMVLFAYSTRMQEFFVATGRRWTVVAISLVIFGTGIAFVHLGMVIPDGEPFAWVEGVSMWPSELIRLVALALSVGFLVAAHSSLDRGHADIAQRFGLDLSASPPQSLCSARGIESSSFFWIARVDPSRSVSAETLWCDYLQRSAFPVRMFRVTVVSIIYLACGTALIFVDPPHVPFRGELTEVIDRHLLAVCVVTFVVLLFFVVDAIKMCTRFAGNLQLNPTDWPDETIKRFSARLNVHEPDDRRYAAEAGYLNDWIDVQFIAEHTDKVARLIWYPFIVIALMVVARSKIFDNWDMPLNLVTVIGVSITYAIACAVTLQLAAEKVREISLNRLTDKLVYARGDPKLAGLAQQLEVLIESIKDLRRGAFLPLSERPLIRAVMLSLTSIGGVSLLEFWSLRG